jgi:hypothetical protein
MRYPHHEKSGQNIYKKKIMQVVPLAGLLSYIFEGPVLYIGSGTQNPPTTPHYFQ